MYLFNKRIYNLDVKNLLAYTYKYFFFLVNHRSNEMITKAFLLGLKLNSFRYTHIYHINKLFLCNSILMNKTFDINNYINFFSTNKSFTPAFLIYNNSFYTYNTYQFNLKKRYLNYLCFFNTSIKKRLLSSTFSMYSINKIKFFSFFMSLSMFFFLNKKYLLLFNKKHFLFKKSII